MNMWNRIANQGYLKQKKKRKKYNRKDNTSDFKKTTEEKPLSTECFNYLKSYYRYKKKDAKRRNIVFNIVFDDWIDWNISRKNTCVYCGQPLNRYNAIKNRIFKDYSNPLYKEYTKGCFSVVRFSWISRHKNMTVDRFDNSKGYTLDNIAKCCWMCNYEKSTKEITTDKIKELRHKHYKLFKSIVRGI